jgi:uncharacterized protein
VPRSRPAGLALALAQAPTDPGAALDKPLAACMIGVAARFTAVKIDLANIAGTPGTRGRFPVSERPAPTEDFACVGPVTGEIAVENTGSLLVVRGRLLARLRLRCVRCLAEFDESVEIDVEEEFATELTEPDVDTIDRDEPAEAAIEDYVLDVAELTRQQVAVNLPMTSVCRPDCRGLCPHCGQDLNQGPCGCSPEAGDARWQKLRDLLRTAPERKQGSRPDRGPQS